MKKLPRIGKRGWLGVVLLVMGLMGFIGAQSQAETETEQSSYQDGVYVGGVNDGIAKDAGYGSFSDALADQNRSSGTFFMIVGSVFVAWGFKKYGDRKPDEGNPNILKG